MASTEQLTEQQKCVPHGTPTLLRCASCDTPVCPRCGRLTEVGQKCLGCAPLRHARSRRSRITSAVLAVGAVAAVVAGISYLSSDSFQKSGDTAPETRTTIAAVGTEVADSQLAFRVRKLECADRELEFDGETVRPQGQFCFLEISVRNDRRADAVLSGDEQYLIDSTGRRYDFDVKATLVNSAPTEQDMEELDFFPFREISPGEDISGVLVYDIPTRARIVEAEFHGVVLDRDGIAYPSARGAKVKVSPVAAPSPSTTTVPPDGPIPVVTDTRSPPAGAPVDSSPPRTFAPPTTTSSPED